MTPTPFSIADMAITSYAAIQFAMGAGVYALLKVLPSSFRWLIVAAITVIIGATGQRDLLVISLLPASVHD